MPPLIEVPKEGDPDKISHPCIHSQVRHNFRRKFFSPLGKFLGDPEILNGFEASPGLRDSRPPPDLPKFHHYQKSTHSSFNSEK